MILSLPTGKVIGSVNANDFMDFGAEVEEPVDVGFEDPAVTKYTEFLQEAVDKFMKSPKISAKSEL